MLGEFVEYCNRNEVVSVEDITYNHVRQHFIECHFDRMDGGDLSVPPKFACEHCGGEMYPEYYIGVHGYEYKVSDILQTQKDRQDDHH